MTEIGERRNELAVIAHLPRGTAQLRSLAYFSLEGWKGIGRSAVGAGDGFPRMNRSGTSIWVQRLEFEVDIRCSATQEGRVCPVLWWT